MPKQTSGGVMPTEQEHGGYTGKPYRSHLLNITLIVALAVLAGSSTLLIIGQSRLSKSRANLNEVIEALAYACGYDAAQRAMLNITGLNVRKPTEIPGCDERRAVAQRNGFTQ